MPKDREKKRAVGIPESMYLEMELYASQQKPQLFLYEVLVNLWKQRQRQPCGHCHTTISTLKPGQVCKVCERKQLKK